MTAVVDLHWREINAEFGCQEIVPENDCDKNLYYQNIDFDFDEIDKTIRVRGRTKISQSTGLALWTCSQILSGFLVENPDYVKGKQVLELGPGLGLCSILAYALGASEVLATDGDFDVLNNLRYNTEQNRIDEYETDISCAQLIWGERLSEFKSTYSKQPVILATDVFYSEHLVEPLWKTVDALLRNDGNFLLGFCPHNVTLNQVLDKAREYGFSWTLPSICEGEGNEKAGDNDDDYPSNTTSFGYHVCIFKRKSKDNANHYTDE